MFYFYFILLYQILKLPARKNTGDHKADAKPQDQLRKRLIARKESFTCLNCEAENPITSGKQLNHCWNCLFSLHVDETIPGDRMSMCRGLMKPVTVSIGRKGSYVITHQCTRCDKIIPNQAAPNDNIDFLIQLVNANPKLAS